MSTYSRVGSEEAAATSTLGSALQALDEASSADELIDALADLRLQVRTHRWFTTGCRSRIIDAAVYKRSRARAIWSHEVARAYRRVLEEIDEGQQGEPDGDMRDRLGGWDLEDELPPGAPMSAVALGVGRSDSAEGDGDGGSGPLPSMFGASASHGGARHGGGHDHGVHLGGVDRDRHGSDDSGADVDIEGAHAGAGGSGAGAGAGAGLGGGGSDGVGAAGRGWGRDDPFARPYRPRDAAGLLGARSFDIPGRRQRLQRYSMAMLCTFSVVLLMSMASGRKFGPYYLSNVLIWCLSLLGLVVARHRRVLKERLVYVEAYSVGMTLALVVGAASSFAFLFIAPDRVDALCAARRLVCTDSNRGGMRAAAVLAATLLMAMYVAIFWAGARDADQLLQAMRLYVDQDERVGSSDTLLTPFAELLGRLVLPSSACAARCQRHCALERPPPPAPAAFRDADPRDAVSCCCVMVCLVIFLISLGVCAAEGGEGVGCAIAEIMLRAVATN